MPFLSHVFCFYDTRKTHYSRFRFFHVDDKQTWIYIPPPFTADTWLTYTYIYEYDDLCLAFIRVRGIPQYDTGVRCVLFLFVSYRMLNAL